MTHAANDIAAVPDPPEAPPTRGIVLNKAAAAYDLLIGPVTLWQDGRMSHRAADVLDPRPTDRVLDVGCATGRMALTVAERLDGDLGGFCVGLDAAPRMITRARRKVGRLPCRFDVGVAERLPYADGVFDKAVSTFFFHHLNLSDKLTALREVHRVLAPGGRFVLVDVDTPRNWFGWLCAKSGEWLFRQPEIGENIDGKLPPLFARAGFQRWAPVAYSMGYVTTFDLSKE